MNVEVKILIDKDVKESAEIIALNRDITLSEMIESYLKEISNFDSVSNKKLSKVNRLSGVIEYNDKQQNKDNYIDYLMQRYK